LVTRIVITSSWGEAPHLSDEAKEGLIGSYKPHERAARTQGIPQLGSGAIYPILESEIVVRPFTLPSHWKFVYGMDVGWNRTAALWLAYDSEARVGYLYSEHYRGSDEPSVHAQAIRSRGEWIPGVIDPAARGRSQVDGQSLLDIYRGLGLNLTKAVNAVESGIWEVHQMLSEGRLKVFDTLQNFLMEYRTYRRDEKGHVVKSNDHLMDTCRYLVISGLSQAVFRPRKDWGLGGVSSHAVDFDPYQGMRVASAGHKADYDAYQGAI
jgi:hypothetical protein